MNLIERAREGDRNAMKELFFSSVSSVYYICIKLMRNESAAISACNATFKRVFSSIDKIEPETDFSAWVKTAAAITCCTELRRSDREVFLSLGLDSPSYRYPDYPPGTSLNMGQTADAMEACIDSLSVSKRAAVILYYFNGLSVSQIARVLACPSAIAKELLVEGRRKLENLQWHLNDIGVKTCSMALLPIFELLSASLVIPDGIHFNEVSPSPIPAFEALPESPQRPKKRRRIHFKRLAFLIFSLLLMASGLVFAVKKVFFPEEELKYSFGSSLFAINFDCVSDKLEGISKDSLFIFEAEEEPKGEAVLAKYAVKSVTIKNENGETLKTLEYTYNDNVLVRAKTSGEVINETLSYKWTKSGTRLTVKNSNGDVVEQTDHNSEGYPVSQIFGDKTVKYKWTYTRYENGRIKTAKYSSDVSGKYTYEYDDEGRVTYLKETRAGVTETEKLEYDENGMVVLKTVTDGAGNKKTYNVSYDFDGLKFTAAASDGSSYSGTLTPTEVVS